MARPLRYADKDFDLFQAKIDEYFDDCAGQPLMGSDGVPMFTARGVPLYLVQPKPMTLTALAYHLGFKSRQALINYAGRPKFHDAITRAKLRIEAYAEERLFDRDGQRGAEFTLRCNFGWNASPNDGDDSGGLDTIIKAIRKGAENDL